MNRLQQRLGLQRFSALYLWVVFIVIFGVWAPHEFLTWTTVKFVASNQAIGGMLAIAVIIPLACGQYDLSVGANANLSGLVAVVLQTNSHWPMVPAVLVGIGVGVLIGVGNGLLVVRFGINSFIATLGAGSVLAALDVIVTHNQQPPPVLSTAWNLLTQRTIGGIQIVFVYLLVLALIVWWMLEHTPMGRYMFATGANPTAARLSGVRVERWTWLSLVISGAISGFSGILFTSLTGPSLTFGPTLLLPAFAAGFLGSTQLRPGHFNVWGTLIAIYVLATGVEGLQLVSGAQWLSDMFNGVALIVAVGLAVGRQRRGGGDSTAGESTVALATDDEPEPALHSAEE